MCDLVKFYEGGLSFEFASGLDYYTIYKLKIEASKINRNIEKASKAK